MLAVIYSLRNNCNIVCLHNDLDMIGMQPSRTHFQVACPHLSVFRGGANRSRDDETSRGATPAAAGDSGSCEYARSRHRAALLRCGGTAQSAAGSRSGRGGEHRAHGLVLRRPRSPQQLLEVQDGLADASPERAGDQRSAARRACEVATEGD